MALVRRAGEEATQVRFYPKDRDGNNYTSEGFTLAVVPSTGGSISNQTTGTDADGFFIQADYTSPASVLTGINLQAQGNTSGEVCFCPITLVEANLCDAEYCPKLTSIVIGSLRTGLDFAGGISAEASDGGAVVFSGVSGLSYGIDSDGSFTGTLPSTPGTYFLSVVVSDSLGSCEFELELEVELAEPTHCPHPINTRINGPVTVGTPFSARIFAEGISPPFVFSAENFPQGVSIDTDGNISGSFAAAGNYSLAYSITDEDDIECFYTLTIVVSDDGAVSCPSVSNISLSSLVAGQSLTGQVNATGVGDIDFEVVTAPAGVNLSASGAITGVVPSAGSHIIEFIVEDDNARCAGSVSFVSTAATDVQQDDCPRLQSINIMPLVQGQQVDGAYTATSPNGSVSFSATGLPDSMGITSTGELVGSAPADQEVITFTLTLNDGVRSCAVDAVLYVQAPVEPQCPKLGSVFLPTAIRGVPYQGFAVFEGEGVLNYEIVGSLGGLVIDPTNGQITGTVGGNVPDSLLQASLRVTDESGTCTHTISIEYESIDDVEIPAECEPLIAIFEDWQRSQSDTVIDFAVFVALGQSLVECYQYWISAIYDGEPGESTPDAFHDWIRNASLVDPSSPGVEALRALDVYNMWLECGQSGSIDKFSGWVYSQLHSARDGWIRELCVLLKCDKTLNGVSYLATESMPAKVTTDYMTAMQLIANGEACRNPS